MVLSVKGYGEKELLQFKWHFQTLNVCLASELIKESKLPILRIMIQLITGSFLLYSTTLIQCTRDYTEQLLDVLFRSFVWSSA